VATGVGRFLQVDLRSDGAPGSPTLVSTRDRALLLKGLPRQRLGARISSEPEDPAGPDSRSLMSRYGNSDQ
jgi:hypothetical protein